jgi:hypothetical protein
MTGRARCFNCDADAQPYGQPDRPQAALAVSLRASRSGGRLPCTLERMISVERDEYCFHIRAAAVAFR